jgi:putative ABC transport system permease protein
LKIILKYISKNLQEEKLRTIVMLLSIVFSSALIFVSLTVGDSYMNAHIKMVKGMSGKATVSITTEAKEDGTISFTKDNIIPKSEDIKNIVGILQIPALFSKDNNFENFDLIAADLDKLNEINKPRLIKEDGYRNFSGNKIVVQEKFSRTYNVKLGDTISLNIMGHNHNFTVVGIAAYDSVFLRQERGHTALLPKDTLEKIVNVKDEYNKILVETNENVDPKAFSAKVSKQLPKNCKAQTVINMTQLKADSKSKSMPFYLISCFSLMMSIFIIYSSYKVITMERLPVIGTFRSIGATEKRMSRILIMESIIYGVLGGIIGIPFGFGLLKAILNKLSAAMPEGIQIPVTASAANIGITCIMALIVSILSAYIPISRVSKLPIKEVVLGTVEAQNISNKTKLVIGVILFIISMILPYNASDKFIYLAGGFSLVCLIISTVILIPLITAAIVSILGKVYGIVFGNEGALAARNLKWNKNINQNIILLLISISSVIVISLVTSCVKTYIGDVFKGAKLDGYSDSNNIDTEFIEKVRKIQTVKAVLPTYVLSNINIDSQSLGRVEGVEDISIYNEMLAVKYKDNKNKNEVEEKFSSGRNIMFDFELMKKFKLKSGDKINIKTNVGTNEYTVLGYYTSRASSANTIIPAKYAKDDFKSKGYGFIIFSASNPDSAAKEIRNLYNGRVNWTRTVKEFNENASSVLNPFFEPLNKLTYFILILGVVGVINNLIINYIQKKRSIAMYKSVGLSKLQHIKISLIEGFTVGLIGGIIGISIAFLEAKTIFVVAGPRIPIEMDIPINMAILAVLMGIAIMLIGSIFPIIKGSKLQVVDEIRFE